VPETHFEEEGGRVGGEKRTSQRDVVRDRTDSDASHVTENTVREEHYPMLRVCVCVALVGVDRKGFCYLCVGVWEQGREVFFGWSRPFLVLYSTTRTTPQTFSSKVVCETRYGYE
jgi:hypothetical protein